MRRLLGFAFATLAASALAQPDVALMDIGWNRVKTVFTDPATRNIYSETPKDCEPLANYADGVLKDRQRYPKGPGADFPAEARLKLFAEIERLPFSDANSTRIVELSAAYWRLAAVDKLRRVVIKYQSMD